MQGKCGIQLIQLHCELACDPIECPDPLSCRKGARSLVTTATDHSRPILNAGMRYVKRNICGTRGQTGRRSTARYARRGRVQERPHAARIAHASGADFGVGAEEIAGSVSFSRNHSPARRRTGHWRWSPLHRPRSGDSLVHAPSFNSAGYAPCSSHSNAACALGYFKLLGDTLSEITGLSRKDPALLRCVTSVIAPCLMMLVLDRATPNPFRNLLEQPAEQIKSHLIRVALAGLREVSASAAESSPPRSTGKTTTKRAPPSGGA